MPDDEEPDEVVEVPLGDELDLHTFAPRDVPELVTHYIDECFARGFPQVRIIHGKGIGALRKAVHAVLEKHPRVQEFRLADEFGGGGWGATMVKLRHRG